MTFEIWYSGSTCMLSLRIMEGPVWHWRSDTQWWKLIERTAVDAAQLAIFPSEVELVFSCASLVSIGEFLIHNICALCHFFRCLRLITVLFFASTKGSFRNLVVCLAMCTGSCLLSLSNYSVKFLFLVRFGEETSSVIH